MVFLEGVLRGRLHKTLLLLRFLVPLIQVRATKTSSYTREEIALKFVLKVHRAKYDLLLDISIRDHHVLLLTGHLEHQSNPVRIVIIRAAVGFPRPLDLRLLLLLLTIISGGLFSS